MKKTIQSAVLVSFGLLAIGTLYLLGAKHLENSRIQVGRITVKTLSDAVRTFHDNNGQFPPTLMALGRLDPNGKGPYIAGRAGPLVDPWGGVINYDIQGPNNGGQFPDVWIVAPNGRILGNW